MNNLESIIDVLERQYLILYLTSSGILQQCYFSMMYNFVRIRPLAEICEQIAILDNKIKKRSKKNNEL